MNIITLQKQADRVEKLTRQLSRALLEFEVMKSKWEIKNGKYKVYSSVKSLMKDILKRTR